MTLGEAAKAIFGAYRLACFDAGGLSYFDVSIRNFWRSFYAAGLVLPFFALLLFMRYAEGEVTAPLGRYGAVYFIAYVISWVLFPLLMVSVARAFDRETHYLRFIISYNWAGVLQNGIYIPIFMLSVTGIIPQALAAALFVVAIIYVFIYTWFIARTAMDISAVLAAVIVVIDLGISVFINSTAESLLSHTG